jgi:uncharacterized protein VirK/YbjX
MIPMRGGYLSAILTRENRIKAMTHHYSYLRHNMDEDFLARLCEKPLPLWTENSNGVLYDIALSIPLDYGQGREGDLCLLFRSDSTVIFILSFTLCPGYAFNVAADHVMYIGRLQGDSRYRESITTSTKNCGDTAPQTLLFTVAQGICLALNIKDMVCTGSRTHYLVEYEEVLDNFTSIYDEFWLSMGARELGDLGYYYTPIPIPQKPLELIKQNHRNRAKKRREQRAAVADQARISFCGLFMKKKSSAAGQP